MRKFTATVKERNGVESCYVVIETDENGQDNYPLLYLREGTNIEDAQALARLLNEKVEKVSFGYGRR